MKEKLNQTKLYHIEYFGVYDNKSNKLVGYSENILWENSVNYSSVKFDPDYLVKNSSASLFYHMNKYYLEEKKYKFVYDGERAIRHKTNIQNYLEKYFDFRQAYYDMKLLYNNKYTKYNMIKAD